MILLLGLPKSGTSSFHKMFQMLGLNSCHQINKNKMSFAEIILNNKKKNCIINRMS